ncbi:MAG: sulfite exporter TauE/SafE family protein [Rhodospirillales bacterium]|nr:sulfite exporter TauE/SafE family protein [Rhodospirillales bacterium]MBO6787326.1 sulfite exporter TauE/SafE family protein [Rhodospirillales bacterium]
MLDPVLLAIVFATFLLAGTVKGIIGLGLPTISLALLTVTTDLTTAMALLLVPSFLTNLWQAMVGGNGAVIVRRIWPFLFMATTSVWVGATALTRVDLALLSALLGLLLMAYAGLGLGGVSLTIKPAREAWAGTLIGATNGVLTGMTGSFVVPGVMFLQAIGLPRDMLIQAMGMLFTMSTLALGVALSGNGLLTMDQGLHSASGVLPAFAGMMVGQHLRKKLSEDAFKRVFFWALLALGAYIAASALAGRL